MASSNPSRLQSQMVDALSCIICFLPYDEKSRLPKVFPCQHTVCQTCAEEMCQQAYSSTFPCPTCRQPVPIPTQGASGLKTNLDVRNIVDIVQKTAACSTFNEDCQEHQNKTITNLEVSTKNISDDNCTNETLQHALDSLDHCMSTIKCSKGTNTAHSISCQKLAAVTFLIDLLRMNPKHKGVNITLAYLGHLCYESEDCCNRVVFLGGADLLMSLFAASSSSSRLPRYVPSPSEGLTDLMASIANDDLCCDMLYVYGMLSVFPSLHPHLVFSKAVNTLVYVLQNFTNEQNYACKPLSFFLCSNSTKWPEQCPSQEEVSALVIDTCKKLPLKKQTGCTLNSLRSYVFLLSQNVNEAAKYWAIWILYRCIDQYPKHYCPILTRDNGVTVLKQQSHAHDFVQRLAKEILKKFDEHSS